jgi:predicted nucleic acid-binding protein
MTLLSLVSVAELGEVAFEMSLALNHSIYDCYFLAAAEKLGPLVTADGVFFAKVKATKLGRHIYLLGEEIPDV